MPFGGPKKPLTEMTRREIFATMIAFTVIGALIIAANVRDLAVRDRGAMALFSLAAILFVLATVGVTCFRAVRELRRRQRL
jgi:hypothetical protein